METLAILVAAGRGERMGQERPKAFLDLGGEPLLLRAARSFERSPGVDAILAVVPKDEINPAREMLRGLEKLQGLVPGGVRRQDSVREGLRAVPKGFDGIVLVHDAARPFVDTSLIDAVAAAARNCGAAIPVLPMVDTIKTIRDGRVRGTLDRSELGAAQTPQGFRFSLLVRAYDLAFRDQLTLTDESMAVERLGEAVLAVPGSVANRKITTLEDLAWAEGLLARRIETTA